MKTTKTRRSGNSLLLGMVYSDVMEPKRGQEYRDRVRSEAMEKLGYQVRTLDNKHSDINLQKHCTANFSDTRRMMRSIESKWKGEIFDHVILDYFFCPVNHKVNLMIYCTNNILFLTGWLGSRKMDR